MKKQISFDKNIEFPTMIGEISAIALDQDLKFVDEGNISGNLLLTGKYKLTEASRLEEDFSYKIPVEIAFSEKIDFKNAEINITDFTYSIKNGDQLDCHIELTVENIEVLDEINDEDLRECDGEVLEKEIEIPVKEDEKKDVEIVDEEDDGKDESTSNFFINMTEEKETYGTFLVYIVRGNETIQSIVDKYETTKEEIEKYNDINNIGIGTKLIIPLLKNE